LRPPHTTQPPTSTPGPAPTPTTFHTLAAQASVADGTPGGDFQVSVPDGWTKFVELRGAQQLLPQSTAVLWLKPDGTDELGVELFRDYYGGKTNDYVKALRQGDPKGGAYRPGEDEILFRTSTTYRSMYFQLVKNGSDLWVVSLTVPTDQETAAFSLFDRIRTSFKVTS